MTTFFFKKCDAVRQKKDHHPPATSCRLLRNTWLLIMREKKSFQFCKLHLFWYSWEKSTETFSSKNMFFFQNWPVSIKQFFFLNFNLLNSVVNGNAASVSLLFSPFSLLFFILLSPPSLSELSTQTIAPVDTSTAAFDVDPLDLDAEEPHESQGDPRSPKGISGSITSPQANAHRLPFFKKVTLRKTG